MEVVTNRKSKKRHKNGQNSMGKKKYPLKKNLPQVIRENERRRIYHRLISLPNQQASDLLFQSNSRMVNQLFIKLHSPNSNKYIPLKKDRVLTLPEAYATAALWLMEILKLSRVSNIRSSIIFPLLYCIRHFLELTMKNALISRNPNNPHLDTHSLLSLWQQYCIIKTNDSKTDRIGQMVNEIHNVDPDGQYFRYAYYNSRYTEKKKLIILSKKYTSIDLICNAFREIYYYFKINNEAFKQQRKKR